MLLLLLYQPPVEQLLLRQKLARKNHYVSDWPVDWPQVTQQWGLCQGCLIYCQSLLAPLHLPLLVWVQLACSGWSALLLLLPLHWVGLEECQLAQPASPSQQPQL